MTADRPIPFAAQIEDMTTPDDVIGMLALREFVAGAQPFACTRRLQRVHDDATLLPPGCTPERFAETKWHRSALASGSGWTLHAKRWRDLTAQLTVTATTEELARQILDEASDGASAPEAVDVDAVTVGFWHQAEIDISRIERVISVQEWSTIRGNYPREVAAAFDRLMAIDAPPADGRLVLLHGPAGTGKTTALRALARAWQDWCQVDIVVDPERLLNDSGYLARLMLGDEVQPGKDKRRWRMLVLEDCDELVRADAKKGTGQSMSRLLNLTDGFIGQGLDLLVCVTTNEPLDNLHPAIARPGRCLAEIHVGPFSVAEAAAWLGKPVGVSDKPLTLAELYARRGDVTKVEKPVVQPQVGQYL